MFIQRDYNRTEKDDFALNVQRYLSSTDCAIPQYINDILCGWIIKSKYE